MNRYKFLIGGAVALAVAAALVFLRDGGEGGMLGDEVSVTVFTSGGKPYGKALIRVPFLKSADADARIDVYLDLNDDGAMSEEEHVVRNVPVRPRANWRVGYPFSVQDELEAGLMARAVLDGRETVEAKISLETYETGELLDLASVKNPEESMKGWIGAAQAGEPATEASRSGVPDLRQRIAECAPTAAANSIMSLAEEHGMSLADLPTPTDIVDGLKGDMDWTPADGVLPDDFVKGKNEWAATNGLPIRTRKVGDQHGASTLEQVLDGMAAGGAAELRLKFGDARGRAVGGHMVTVTGVRAEGGQTFIDVNDPNTPAGTETYEVVGNEVVGYPFDGITVLSWGFVQVWEGTPTGTALEPMTEEEVRGIKEFVGEKEKVKVIISGGKKIPISQVHVGKGPECDSEANQIPHYHANAGSVTALDGAVIPDPGGCGYGKVPQVPVEEVEVP